MCCNVCKHLLVQNILHFITVKRSNVRHLQNKSQNKTNFTLSLIYGVNQYAAYIFDIATLATPVWPSAACNKSPPTIMNDLAH